ncbi:Murein hydrolase activator NlpD [Candidatus Erwinia haradaeae]|uniref:Murein hydrolase activator NlpD n=1 Tax=Candidatus Erwinia haradaeae TaxID=1922217 RepID=A0A451CYN3_9GAMM|nr:murein hydrolase activator NlpD [Candidatus Erwinia haradaeae]VFP78516.1 Murein hydrolase activator NlpD [Candidatus Erwinia haradaeae]
MKIEKLLFKANSVVVITILGFGLIGCSKTMNTEVAINIVGKNTSNMLSNYFNQVKNITKITISHPIQKRSLSILDKRISLNISKLIKINKIVAKQGFIVYRKKNKNIKPKTNNQANYIVKKGDTLFHIASITNNTVRHLASHNNIPIPYVLTIGQKLNILKKTTRTKKYKNTETTLNKKNKKGQSISRLKIKTKKNNIRHKSNMFYPKKLDQIHKINAPPLSNRILFKKSELISTHIIKNITKKNIPLITSWKWPAHGKIIDNFSSEEGGNKGIDIAGVYGHAVVSTAPGQVVYAGNELRGYGNLIIIKHNNDYLSAYAHNATIFVAKQQTVKAGQTIATMGNSGTNSVRLHFELRYKGKSVNPLYYLPKR